MYLFIIIVMVGFFLFGDKGEATLGTWIFFGIVLLIFIIVKYGGSEQSPSSHGTDGIYESACNKIDRGLPINESERTRMNDILNYKEQKRSHEIEKENGER